MNPAIEFFRGIAALMVLTSHYYVAFISEELSVFNFLMTGYDFFFVISGFVFGKTIYSTTSVSLFPYMIRRFFRIYPLYVCSLVLYYLFTATDPDKLLYFFRHLFFLQTTGSVREVFFFNPAYWTLPVEIEFYILVPALAFLNTKYPRLILVLLPCSIAFRYVMALFSLDPPAINIYTLVSYHLPGFFIEFIVGILLYRVSETYQHNKKLFPLSIVALFIGISILVLSAFLFLKFGPEGLLEHALTKSYFTPFCACGYACILFFSLSLIKTFNVKNHFIGLCLFMGKISYGMYLFHNLIPLIFRKLDFKMHGIKDFLLCLAIVIVLSMILNYSLEQPLRSYGRRLSKRLEDKIRRSPVS